jgi:catechol 2,3-dioxygenase-like lactoylglutathione lyase family enzyme
MAITIDHMTLPARDNDASAEFIAAVFDIPYAGLDKRGWAALPISPSFTLIYVPIEPENHIHVAFHVDEVTAGRVIANLQKLGVDFGNDPRDPYNGRDDHPFGGRGVFVHDPTGHVCEVLTRRGPA